MDRNSFVFYKYWKDAIQDLPDDVRLEIYESIIEYATTGNFKGLKPMASIAFNFVKTMIDRDVQSYVEICEKNRENGSKGGAPKGNRNALKKQPKTTQNNPKQPKQPKQPDNDNDNDNDNDLKKKESIPKGMPKKDSDESSCVCAQSDFEKFNSWISKSAPYCANPKNFTNQITEIELDKLKKKYTSTQIADVIINIENRKDLRKRYTNLYKTVLNWAKKEYGE